MNVFSIVVAVLYFVIAGIEFFALVVSVMVSQTSYLVIATGND